MKRFASVTFDGVLAASDRDVAMRSLASAGTFATSWSVAAGRTYAFVRLAGESNAIQMPAGTRVDEPPLVVLRVMPHSAARRSDLERVLASAAGPAGAIDARSDGDALVVTFAPRVTSLTTVVASIDAVLGRHGRTIEPLLPLDDETLAAFAGELLREPHLTALRVLETHVEPLLASEMP